MSAMARAGPSQIQESVTPSPMWVTGVQVLGPSSTAFSCELAGSWIQSEAGTRISAPMEFQCLRKLFSPPCYNIVVRALCSEIHSPQSYKSHDHSPPGSPENGHGRAQTEEGSLTRQEAEETSGSKSAFVTSLLTRTPFHEYVLSDLRISNKDQPPEPLNWIKSLLYAYLWQTHKWRPNQSKLRRIPGSWGF